MFFLLQAQGAQGPKKQMHLNRGWNPDFRRSIYFQKGQTRIQENASLYQKWETKTYVMLFTMGVFSLREKGLYWTFLDVATIPQPSKLQQQVGPSCCKAKCQHTNLN